MPKVSKEGKTPLDSLLEVAAPGDNRAQPQAVTAKQIPVEIPCEARAWCAECFQCIPKEAEIEGYDNVDAATDIEDCPVCGGLRIEGPICEPVDLRAYGGGGGGAR